MRRVMQGIALIMLALAWVPTGEPIGWNDIPARVTTIAINPAIVIDTTQVVAR